MIARNCNWFIALFVPVVIGRSNISLVLVLRQSFENRSTFFVPQPCLLFVCFFLFFICIFEIVYPVER